MVKYTYEQHPAASSFLRGFVMPTGNHDYVIDVQGKDFESFQVTETLPEAFVDEHKGGNKLAGSILLHWLERKPERKHLFARLTSESEAVARFTVRMRDV